MAKKTSKVKTKSDQQDLKAMEDKWQRALADYQNLTKRVEQQQAMYIKLASLSLVKRLIEVVDHFERALSHLQDPGVKMIYDELKRVLSDEGLTEVEVMGKTFDPSLMECTEKVAGEANRVIRVHQKGYQLNGILIRPAKVAVGVK